MSDALTPEQITEIQAKLYQLAGHPAMARTFIHGSTLSLVLAEAAAALASEQRSRQDAEQAVCAAGRRIEELKDERDAAEAKLIEWQALDDAIRATLTRVTPGDKARDICGSIEQLAAQRDEAIRDQNLNATSAVLIAEDRDKILSELKLAEASRADAEPLGPHLLGDPLTSQLLDLIRLMPDAQTQVILDFIVDMRAIRAGHRAP